MESIFDRPVTNATAYLKKSAVRKQELNIVTNEQKVFHTHKNED